MDREAKISRESLEKSISDAENLRKKTVTKYKLKDINDLDPKIQSLLERNGLRLYQGEYLWPDENTTLEFLSKNAPEGSFAFEAVSKKFNILDHVQGHVESQRIWAVQYYKFKKEVKEEFVQEVLKKLLRIV